MVFSQALPVQFWVVDKSTYNEASVCGLHYSCFCSPWNASDQINLQFQEDDDLSLVIKDSDGVEGSPIAMNRVGDLNYLSIIPEDYGFTDEQIQLLVKNGSSQTVLKSDCLDVQESHSCTTLVNYYDTKNYACLIYENTSPDQTFNIRVPSIFFHERYPEEDEVLELITTDVQTANQVKTQRRLDINSVPYYFHYKMKLILKHKFVIIDEFSWVKEEEYEVNEGDRRWPVKKANVWLTQKNSIVRNVL